MKFPKQNQSHAMQNYLKKALIEQKLSFSVKAWSRRMIYEGTLMSGLMRIVTWM
jgi:hypothetical protein